MLSFLLLDQTVSELRQLSQLAARRHLALGQLEPAELDYIQRNVRISMIGASTRIENAVLTDAEVDWLDTILAEDARTTAYEQHRDIIEDKLSKDKERSVDEVAGCRAMLHLIYSQPEDFQPLSKTVLRGLHSELLRYHAPASRYRGRYKAALNRVVKRNLATGQQTTVLQPSDPGPITAAAMQQLVQWYNATISTHPWTVAVASEFVLRFLAIHPFQDGNGRLGRGLFLLALLHSPDESLRAVAPQLAIDRHIERQREDYYIVLRRCSGGKFNPDPTGYHYQGFLRFMMKTLTRALDDVDAYRSRYAALRDLPPSALAVLNAFKERPERRLQRKDLIEHTALPRATVTVALRKLTHQRFIARQGRGSSVRYQLVF